MRQSKSLKLCSVMATIWLGSACNNDPASGDFVSSPSGSRSLASTLLSPEGNLLKLQAPAPTVTPAGDLPPLDIQTKVAVAGVPANFISTLLRMQKVNDNFFVFNSNIGTSWYYETSATGDTGANLTRFTSPVIPPAVGETFSLYNAGFWMVTPSFVATRSLASPEKDGGVNAIQVTTSLNQSAAKLKTLYVDDLRFIITDGKTISLNEREKDRIFNADTPIPLDQATGAPYKIITAGLGDQSDHYWFLTPDSLLMLKRSEGAFNWFASKFTVRVNGAGPSETGFGLGMIVNFSDPKSPRVLNNVMAYTSTGVYAQKPLSIVYLEPLMQAAFTAEVLPAIRRTCVPCHPGFDQFQTLISKRADFQTRMSSKSMPPATSPQMSGREKAIVMSWLSKLDPK